MQYQYIPYILPLFASAFISLSLGIYALLKRRNAKGTNSFILSMFVVTIWSFGNALEMASTTFSNKLFWANVQYFAYCYSPITLLALCLQFTGYDKWVRNRKLLWLAVIPTIIILLVWTDPYHGLIRYDMHMDYSGAFPVIEKKYGPLFIVHALYSHSINILAWILLIKAVLFKNTVYRKQATALFVGVNLIVIPNIIYIMGFSPIAGFDITPLFFGPAGLIIALGIYRYKLFDVVPLARATVIETMNAGVMILDLQNRILDINPAFEKIVGYSASQISTKSVEEVCSHIPELVRICTGESITDLEITIVSDEVSKVYEVLLSTLSDDKDMRIGRIVVTREITEKKLSQQAYLKQQWRLAAIEERERMARDLHDNLGQVLGFINLQTQGIRQELHNAGIDTASQKLDKLVEVTQTAHNEIRKYISNARSQAALEKGFLTALKKKIEVFQEQTDIDVEFNIPLSFTGEELKPDVWIQILYISTEALNNIQKHSKANHVKLSIELMPEESKLCIIIEEDGIGFDVNGQAGKLKEQYGLSIMRERASEIGGQIIINSAQGSGSSIKLYVPVKEECFNENEIDAGR